MNKIISAVLLLAIIPAVSWATPPSDYKIVWQDEFKSPSLDLTKWKPDIYKRDSARLTPDAITIGPEGLKIRTYTDAGTHYTGFMTSKGLYATTYGYFEARIRFHGAPGEWCAFWIQPEKLGKIIGDPGQSGVETDIVEHRVSDKGGNDISNVVGFHVHWDGYKTDHKVKGIDWAAPASLDNDWHIYSVLWTKDGYIFYVDDVERWRTNVAISHAPQHLRLTCEVKDQSWAGTIPEHGYGEREKSPYGMDVNWVRVWQHVP